MTGHRHSRRAASVGGRVLLVSLSLLALAALPPGVAAQDANAPSPASGDLAVIAQGVAEMPADEIAWQVVRDTAASPEDAAMAAHTLGFVVATDDAILLTDETSDMKVRLAAGEAAFTADSARQQLASLGDGKTLYARLALVPADQAEATDSGLVFFTGDAFPAPPGERDLDLIRGQATDEVTALDPGPFPMLLLVIEGEIEVLPEDEALTMKKGRAAVFEGPVELRARQGSGPATFVAAIIGPDVGETGGPTTPSANPTGSVTARVFVCPPGLSPVAVQESTAPASLLADCGASSQPVTAPRLRAVPGGSPAAGDEVAPGVFLWADLSLGAYDFGGGNAPSGFGGRLITNGAGTPVADQEAGAVEIDASTPNVERRFYYFAPEGPDTGSISLTLYRCPSADDLSAGSCALMTDPPIDVAGIFQEGWTEANLSGFDNGRAAWSGLPLGRYSVGFGGVAGPGEAAAIPALSCTSTSGCEVLIGPAAPDATLDLFVYPIAANEAADPATIDTDGDQLSDVDETGLGTDPTNPDTDGDGYSDGEEVANDTDPLAFPPSGTGAADHDGDGLSNNDEAALGTDPGNPDTDGDGFSDGEEVANETDPLAFPPSGSGAADHDGDGLSNNDEAALGTSAGNPDTDGDGVTDGAEVAAGTDPLAATDS